jgi:hypothetical protein
MAIIFYNPGTIDLMINSIDNSLKISIIIGYGQAENFSIYANTDLISLGKDVTIDSLKNYENGDITIMSTIKDKITHTNMTSVTVKFKEGEFESKIFKFEQELSKHLDTIVYLLSFKIISNN